MLQFGDIDIDRTLKEISLPDDCVQVCCKLVFVDCV